MITYSEVCRRTRKVIADITNRDISDISPEKNLNNDLGFTRPGKRGLAATLNTEFEKENLKLTPDDTEKCDTVGDVCDLVWDKLPQKEKQS